MTIMQLLAVVIALTFAGCAYPSNFTYDLGHMGDPTYDDCRRGADVWSNYGVRCAQEAAPMVKAAKAEQVRQAEEQQTLAAEATRQYLAARQHAKLTKGYSPTTIQDFVLDGKELATREAERSFTGVYLPVGNLGLLFGTTFDAIQFSNGRNLNSPAVHLITENASRDFRRRLLVCRSDPASAYGGCPVHVLGRATMCVLTGPSATGARRLAYPLTREASGVPDSLSDLALHLSGRSSLEPI